MADDIAKPEPVRTGPPEELPATPDPVDIAMEAERRNAASGSPARVLLEKQARLIDDQRRLLRLERADRRMAVSLKGLTAAAVLAAAAVFGVMVWNARQADGLVIEAFSAPPDLAARGVTGEVIASQLLDRLTAWNAVPGASLRAPESYADDWSDSIEVEIPQTGVSVGELDRYLRARLGSQLRVRGEVFRDAEGLTVSARAGGRATARVAGPEGELGRLLDQTAEAIFAATQPYRYGQSLVKQGRLAEARAVLEKLERTGPPAERPWGAVGLGTVVALTEAESAALAVFERGVAAGPDNALALTNAALGARRLGLPERALRHMQAAVRVLERGSGGVRPDAHETYLERNRAAVALFGVDPLRAAAIYEKLAGRDVPALTPVAVYHSEARLLLHETTRARQLMASLRGKAWSPTTGEPRNRVARTQIEVETWAEAGDWGRVAAVREAALPWLSTWGPGAEHDSHRLAPAAAVALARLGRLAEAQALVATTPADRYPGLVARAKVAEIAGHKAAADSFYARAVQLTPSLPIGLSEWGRTRLARNDLDGAVRLFRQAHEREPRWADPLKYEGDALGRKGDHRAAVRRYRQAAERAPRWGALHLAWGRSLAALGREEQARAKYAQAARLDLSTADRDAVERFLAR